MAAGLQSFSLIQRFTLSVSMNNSQLDRDTELTLPAENLNVGVSANPFDASSAIEQHILIGLE